MITRDKKINFIIFALAAIALLLLGVNVGIRLGKRTSAVTSVNRSLFYRPDNKITQTLDLILSSYVDSVSQGKLEEDAIAGMLGTLDPHSQYIPAAAFASANEPIEGNFSGIGVQFNMLNDTITIINTIPKGPSEKAGILAGDRIILVEGRTVSGVKMASDEIVKMLKGKTGTKVKVSVLRRDEPDLLEFEITRDKIPLFSVDAAYMLTPETGYVKVHTFSKTTIEEFAKALEQLKERGMRKLVLDLRNNAGGLIDPAIGMAELFLPEGKPIVYTEGNERPRTDYRSKTRDTTYVRTELALLINESSASASEIVSGALQDNDRSVIIGRRSFGKGLVQEQYPLIDGSAVRLTVARYYTPTGRSIQKPYNDKKQYFDDLNERYRHGEMEQADSIRFNDSLKYVTPEGKTVYGGGGIMPDIFMPLDTSFYSRYYERVMRRGLVYRFAFEYTDRRRKELAASPDDVALEKKLRSDGVMEQFIRYAERQSVARNAGELKISGAAIEDMLIAYIVRNIFDETAFYRIINRQDTMIQKAVELLTENR
ncbi:MAG: S41 family peptidase [Bacteroidales bacterium]|jgi:carboxyl-terminal processing protease|nr:S41 family peptidase [Bacteroidales bacterium]